jgi:predicted house-cleaning noncanonical NTP pyrophosphatase (MazG superfamily)
MSEKLVRDRIPEVMAAHGQVGRFRTAGPQEILPLLIAKVQEEAAEIATSNGSAEEICDLLEVLEALAAHGGYSQKEIQALREERRRGRGGFDLRLVLIQE